MTRVRQTVTRSASSPTWSVLVAIHPRPDSRWRASLLAGYANVTHHYRAATIVAEELGPDGEVRNTSVVTGEEDRFWWPGLTFGVALTRSLGRHLHAGADVRFIAFPWADNSERAPIVRPATWLRWIF